MMDKLLLRHISVVMSGYSDIEYAINLIFGQSSEFMLLVQQIKC
jgi:hypothetical protein